MPSGYGIHYRSITYYRIVVKNDGRGILIVAGVLGGNSLTQPGVVTAACCSVRTTRSIERWGCRSDRSIPRSTSRGSLRNSISAVGSNDSPASTRRNSPSRERLAARNQVVLPAPARTRLLAISASISRKHAPPMSRTTLRSTRKRLTITARPVSDDYPYICFLRPIRGSLGVCYRVTDCTTDTASVWHLIPVGWADMMCEYYLLVVQALLKGSAFRTLSMRAANGSRLICPEGSSACRVSIPAKCATRSTIDAVIEYAQ